MPAPVSAHPDPGPAEVVLRAAAARSYYFDGLSKSDIASRLGVSRFRVARLLDAARASGLVRIELDPGREIDLDRSVRLQEALGLRHCVVAAATDVDDHGGRAVLGRACARLLSEVVNADDVLGLAWSRALAATRDALTSLDACDVVQLTGALRRPDVDDSSIELVRDVARVSGGTASYFYAPMLVSDAATARSLREEPDVAAAIARYREVTIAVVGLGAWKPGLSTVADAVSDAERRAAWDAGARAEFSGIMLDAEGGPVQTPLTSRLVAVDGQTLRDVPEVVAVVHGRRKARALLAAVRGGYVTSVVTGTDVADELVLDGTRT